MEYEENASVMEEETKEGRPKTAPKRRPIKGLKLNFPYSQANIDLALWESRMSEKGKLMPSSISLRLQDADPSVTRNAIYFKAADALKIANILQNFAYSAMQEDQDKRFEFSKIRKGAPEPIKAI
ncbi:MAG: hypothetical protein ABIG96_06945 [Candidatus Micrarchaeota archaeon]